MRPASAAKAGPVAPHVLVLEPGEHLPGGAATSKSRSLNAHAFSQASGNMPFEDEFRFKIGNGVFKKVWVSSPSSTKASDGLGPLYNARSCQGCHIKDGRGHPPDPARPEASAVSFLLRLSIPADAVAVQSTGSDGPGRDHAAPFPTLPEPVYGWQLQDLAVQGHDAEGVVRVVYEEIPVKLRGGETVMLRRPLYSVADAAYGPLHQEVMISPRVAPPMIGLGLLEAIREEDILRLADPDDADGDGISGRANWAVDPGTGQKRLGRFGWKATAPTIRAQTAEAFAGDLGISSPLIRRPAGDCTPAQRFCLNAPHGESAAGFEIDGPLFDLVVFYSQNLAVPPRRGAADARILRGKRIFNAIGCASCHQPSFTTGEAPGQPHLSGQLIWPYTDMLLHDMGEGLADNRPDGEASGREWRTPPLWGVGLTQAVNGHTLFLHDGRARSVAEAILWHGGEGQAARDAFAQLTPDERASLIAFVNSL
jgi:CxxC motif-containing protein (DUF1111 family)